MINLDLLIPDLEQALKEERIIDKPNLYLVRKNVLGKRAASAELTQREYAWGTFAAEQGFPVPKLYGVVSPEQFKEKVPTFFGWYLLMEKLAGEPFSKLTEADERDKAAELYRAELKRLLDLGIFPHDSNSSGNVLFNRKERKIYLIDLQRWKWGTEHPQGMKMYQKLAREGKVSSHYESMILNLDVLKN